jgi:hypothetical protein
MNESPRKRAESLKELGELFQRTSTPNLVEKSIASYQPRATDVIITPFGKSGTTWTQQIFHTLRTRGDMDFDDISRVVPWIETSGSLEVDINAEQRADPRGFKSHLDFEKMPKGAKYINVIRHPVDAAYSAFKFMEGWYVEPGAIPADDFVMMSARDQRYHKHFISWWPHRHDENVLYLVYEHMLKNPAGTIKQIAEFSGIDLDDELLAITLEHSSLPYMQKYKDRFDDAMMRKKSEESVLPEGSDSAKVRAGKSGDHTLSAKSVETLNQIWRDTVTPVTGFDTYKELIASLD